MEHRVLYGGTPVTRDPNEPLLQVKDRLDKDEKRVLKRILEETQRNVQTGPYIRPFVFVQSLFTLVTSLDSY